MAAIPYMPLYIADYLSDAAHLSTTEHGAYMLLIMTYWQRGKPLPADSRRLANIARMTPEAWAAVEPTISEFFQVTSETWAHKRVESELEKFRQKSEKAIAAGKASAAQRRSNGRSTDVERTFNHTDTDSNTDTDKEPVSSLARADDSDGKEQELHIDFGKGKRRGVSPKLQGRAEGLGLNVERLLAKTIEKNPDSPNGYFRALCRTELRALLPTATDDLLDAALLNSDAAFASVCSLIISTNAGSRVIQ
jgi:uncharacterized protein YdaU (DUF1376 family)